MNFAARSTRLAFTSMACAGILFSGFGAAMAAPGNIDDGATGSITIVKLEQPDNAGGPATGRPQNVDSMKKLPGATFKVQRVTAVDGVDVTDKGLKDPKAWEALSKATVENSTPGAEVGSGTTEADGEVKISDLPVGLYLVTETQAPAGAAEAAPFLVALPFNDDKGTADKADDAWNYDVTVYPKNSVSSVAKELNEASDAAALKTGDTVTWNVTGALPANNENARLTAASYTDTLDARLGYVKVENVKFAGKALADGDYTVENNGQDVTVTLSDAWLKQDHPKGDLTFDIVTSMKAGHDDLSDGVIPNQVTQTTVTNGGKPVTVTSEKPETKWGEVTLAKQDAGNKKRLEGAEFQLFASEADAKAGDNAITVDGENVFTTGDVDLNGDGSVSADEQGTLRISALNTGAEGSRDYWIKETKAPNGYTLPSGDAAIHKVTVTPGVKTVAEITVDNTANSNITLPVTGAAGTAGLLALAGALAASGAVVVIRNKKKASVEE